MNEDGFFTIGFFAGMFAMWILQRLIGAWKERRRAKDHPQGELPADERARAEEIRALNERLAVLERIATDPAERTAREIEALR